MPSKEKHLWPRAYGASAMSCFFLYNPAYNPAIDDASMSIVWSFKTGRGAREFAMIFVSKCRLETRSWPTTRPLPHWLPTVR
jgi:hypothetical protein